MRFSVDRMLIASLFILGFAAGCHTSHEAPPEPNPQTSQVSTPKRDTPPALVKGSPAPRPAPAHAPTTKPLPNGPDLASAALFQDQFFPLEHGPIECDDAKSGFMSLADVRRAIDYYESKDPKAEEASVRLLTYHMNPDHVARVARYAKECRGDGHCVLARYWGSEESGLRVLALFYDTGTAMRRSNGGDFTALSTDQIRAIEKAIRKIPPALRRLISRGLTSSFVDPNEPTVFGGRPFEIGGSDERSTMGNLGLVISNYNSIGFAVNLLDKARSGKRYRDVGYRFIADVRLQMILHEIGHVVDGNFLGTQPMDFLSWHIKDLLESELQGIWPSHWWRAFEGKFGIKHERYVGKPSEKFAEMFAQYILLPQALRKGAPQVYAYLKDKVFDGIEYAGYERCAEVARPLSKSEKWFAPLLLE